MTFQNHEWNGAGAARPATTPQMNQSFARIDWLVGTRGKFLLLLLTLFLAGTGASFAQQSCAPPMPLTAGQTINVGTVTVCNDANNIYVTYTLTYSGATFGNLQMWAGNNLANVPSNQNGIPVPGQFCQALGGACYDATGLTTYTFTIPFSSLNIVDANAACGSQLYVVTHAEVQMPGGSHQTAFGGSNTGTGNRWWFYGTYAISCQFGDPPPVSNKTAFAKGGYIWTTDRKSNPESLPSLRLTQNRWGWAINLTATGTTEFDIWAGAGLNDTSKGVKVGRLTVNWNGSTAVVTYNLFSGFLLQEVHLYAKDPSPTVLAPGQYGYLDSFEPTGVSTATFTVPLADTNGPSGVWLIAHAVVSGAF